MVAVFKVSCFPFLNCFASFLLDIIFLPALPSRTVCSLLLRLHPPEKISSPMQDLFCTRKQLTYPGSASVQCGLHGRTDYLLSQPLTFFTQTSVSYRTQLLSRIKIVIFRTNIDLYVPRWISSEKKLILCNFLLIRFVHYKFCAKIYLFRSSQSVLALIFRCE